MLTIPLCIKLCVDPVQSLSPPTCLIVSWEWDWMSYLPVGWAVWWWLLPWRAMAGSHRSSLSWGWHKLRRGYLQHHHHTRWHRPWYTSCNFQDGCRMEDCTKYLEICAVWTSALLHSIMERRFPRVNKIPGLILGPKLKCDMAVQVCYLQ